MSDLTPTKRGSSVSAAGSRRTYAMTAQIVVAAEADLSDPFTRIVVFRALAAQPQAPPPCWTRRTVRSPSRSQP